MLNETYFKKVDGNTEKSSADKEKEKKDRWRTYTITNGVLPHQETILHGSSSDGKWLDNGELMENTLHLKMPLANSSVVAPKSTEHDYRLLSDSIDHTNEESVKANINQSDTKEMVFSPNVERDEGQPLQGKLTEEKGSVVMDKVNDKDKNQSSENNAAENTMKESFTSLSQRGIFILILYGLCSSTP